MIITPLDDFLTRVGTGSKLRARGNGKWIMCCPAHTDTRPSLLVDARSSSPNVGAVSFTCLAGCRFKDVARAFEGAGLIESDRAIIPSRSTGATPSETSTSRHDHDAQEQLHVDAAKRVGRIIRLATPANKEHPYLFEKRIKPNGALQYRHALLLPLVDFDGVVRAAQFIDANGNKSNARNTRRRGTFYRMTGRNDYIFIAEGFSTGASVHEATGCTTYCAMGLTNLGSLTSDLIRLFGTSCIVIAADNDIHHRRNPGLTTANQIAKDLHVRMVWPEALAGATDWNDYQRYFGQAGVRSAIAVQLGTRLLR